MKILITTQYFPPEMGAPQARLYELATRLSEAGHEITVLTAMPNYPTGKVFQEYRWRWRTTDMMDGLRVIRTWIHPSISRRAVPRVLSYLSFSVSSVLLGIWGIGRQDVVVIESPPLFLVPFAQLVSRLIGGKAVMMVSDIWPQGLIEEGTLSADALSGKILLWLERFCYNHSYAVALTNPGACQRIRDRFPELKNVTLISNGVDTNKFHPSLRNEATRKQYGCGPDDFLIGYCGLHGVAQGLEIVVEAARRLQDKQHIKFMMIGDGPTKQELILQARAANLSNLIFHDPVPKREMPPIVAAMDVSLIPLAARMPGTMPSKVYEALASGVPPLVPKGCEAEKLVSDSEVGACYEPGNADEFTRAILSLTDRSKWERLRGECIKLAKRFDRNVIAERTAGVLDAIAKGRPLPPVEW